MSTKRLRGDEGVDIITIYSMVGISLIIIILIPFLIWTKGLTVARLGQAKLTQQAALAAAAQVEVVGGPNGDQVLRIDTDLAAEAAVNYYQTQKPFVRDMFNYSVLNAAGKQMPSIASGDFAGTGCTLEDDYGCIGYTVQVQDYYDGSFFSRWLFRNVPSITVGYAEIAANAAKCDAQTDPDSCVR